MTYQTMISEHDTSLVYVFYTTTEEYIRHNDTVSKQIWKHPKYKQCNTIHHIITERREP